IDNIETTGVDRREAVSSRQSNDQLPVGIYGRACGYDYAAVRFARDVGDCTFDLCGTRHGCRRYLDAESRGATLHLPPIPCCDRIDRIVQKGSTRDVRRNLLEQFQPFHADRLLVSGKPCDIAARAGYGCYKTVGDRIGYVSKYDWDGACRPLQRGQGDGSNGDQYVRPQFNQLCRGGTETVRISSETIIDPDVTTLYPSELLQCLAYH